MLRGLRMAELWLKNGSSYLFCQKRRFGHVSSVRRIEDEHQGVPLRSYNIDNWPFADDTVLAAFGLWRSLASTYMVAMV